MLVNALSLHRRGRGAGAAVALPVAGRPAHRPQATPEIFRGADLALGEQLLRAPLRRMPPARWAVTA